jgi:hypothetical protein
MSVAQTRTRNRNPGMLVPRWTRSEGGVWMPAPPGRETLQLELGRNVAGARIVAVLDKLPDSESQVFAFLDERAVGLAVSTLPQQINRVACVSFESAALYISVMSMATAQVPPGRERQITLVQELFIDGEIAAGAERALAAGEGSVAFAEQHLSAPARLAVRHSDSHSPADLERDAPTLERALIGCSALAMGDSERITGEHAELFDAVAMLVHHGAFYTREPLANALARNSWLYGTLALSSEGKMHPESCDPDTWARADTGLGLLEQFAAGMAALGSSRAIDDDGPLRGRGLLSADWATETAHLLGVSAQTILDALSAEPGWYAEEFERIEKAYRLDEWEAVAGWTTAPFETKPFVRLRDGRLCLWSARALLSWLTDGFYYRALTYAEGEGRGHGFTTFNGWLVERYAREVVDRALPAEKPHGSGRALGSVRYKGHAGGLDSPDIALDYGPDLVFVEVCSGRLRLDTRLTGDPARVREDLRRVLTGKAQQLSRRIDDYLNGAFELEGVDRNAVERVWPVVLTGASFLMTELVYEWIIREIGKHLRQPATQPLTVLDIADWEQLCGLVEVGWTVPRLLARKVGAYRGLDWRRMVKDDPYLPHETRPSVVAQQADRAFRDAVARLGFQALAERGFGAGR